MTLLLLEALLALGVFVGIIYWTMFSGRKRGELDNTKADSQRD
jgi:cbb3-type cytochrome oxidase subunit 3